MWLLLSISVLLLVLGDIYLRGKGNFPSNEAKSPSREIVRQKLADMVHNIIYGITTSHGYIFACRIYRHNSATINRDMSQC